MYTHALRYVIGVALVQLLMFARKVSEGLTSHKNTERMVLLFVIRTSFVQRVFVFDLGRAALVLSRSSSVYSTSYLSYTCPIGKQSEINQNYLPELHERA